MKMKILCVALFALNALDAFAMGRRTPQPGQTPGWNISPVALNSIGTNNTSVIQGGTIADAGLFNGPVMIATAEAQVPGAPARVVIAGNFGADVAPNSGRFDEKTQDLKNDLGRVIEAAKGNPYAAAAVAALQTADKALAPPPQLPLGDRTGGQFFGLMEGTSTDVAAFGSSAVQAFADMRAAAHGVVRANSEVRSVDRLVVSNDAAMVTSLGLKWIDYLTFLAQDDQEDPAPSPAPDRKPDGQPDLPDAGEPLVGDNNGLWKPVSENNGKLVVLTPANVGRPEAVRVNGTAGSFSSIANGNRAHFRFPNPGASYGKNVEVVAVFPGGKTLRTVIPDGSKRTTWRWPSIASPPSTNSVTNTSYTVEGNSITVPASVMPHVIRVKLNYQDNPGHTGPGADGPGGVGALWDGVPYLNTTREDLPGGAAKFTLVQDMPPTSDLPYWFINTRLSYTGEVTATEGEQRNIGVRLNGTVMKNGEAP